MAATVAVERLRGLLEAAGSTRLVAEEANGCALIRLRAPGAARGAFTTRVGGVSPPPFDSLDLTVKTGDDPANVARNRARLSEALDFGGDFVSPTQVHGARVVGTAEYQAESPAEADGLVLHARLDRDLAALLLYADCLPVVLVGEVDMAVVHAGWRGLLGGVIQQAGRAMTGPPALAFLGPSIGPCCYEVDEDLLTSFARRYGSQVTESRRLDLWAAAGSALGEIGLDGPQIENPRLCTHCHPDLFYSHRRDGGVTGRQGAVAWYEAGGGD